MFDKTRERIQKLEEDHDNLRKLHAHVVKHQTKYIIGGTTVLSGVVFGGVGYAVGKGHQRPIVIDFKPEIAPVFNNAPTFNNNNVGNQVKNVINNAGRLHKLIKRINPDGSEQLYETIGDAAIDFAEETGLKLSSARQLISDCINGRKPSVHDLQFVSVGTGTR